MSSRLRHYLVLGIAAVVLSSGSAYAGGALARNSVGSVQVRDNALLTNDIRNGTLNTRDVRDRSLRRTDVALGQVPRTYTIQRRVPEGNTRVLTIPGFSQFNVTCSATSIGLNVSFGDGDPATNNPVEQHGLMASDIGDTQPRGGATVTGQGGGVGFASSGGAAPGSGILVRGDYWGRSQRLLAHGTFSWGFPAVPCLFRLQLVIQELATPVPVSRAVPGQRRRDGSVCEVSGGSAAYCLEP